MKKIDDVQLGRFLNLFNRSGYVLNFSTGSFDAFTLQSVGVAICSKYGLSKGKSLIAFLDDASDEDRYKLLHDLFDYYEKKYQSEYDSKFEPDSKFDFSPYFNEEYSKLYYKCKAFFESDSSSASIETAAKALQDSFSSEYLSQQIQLMVSMQDTNPTDAIGKSKELIESCCKTILEARNITWSKDWDTQKLAGQTMLALQIMPDNIIGTDSAAITAKALLGNLLQVSIRMAELRNPYGTGHGKSASFKPLPSRYARLAVGASVAFVRFLWDTHEERLNKKNGKT